ncbi:hypothetical protein [Streptomyces sp. NPDC055607]
MRTRHITAALAAVLLLGLTACGTATEEPEQPAVTTVTGTPTLSADEQRKACVDAIAATIRARPNDFNPDTDSDPKPDACATIPESDYLDAYMDGLKQSNQAGIDDLQKAIEDAASATPSP